MRTTTTRTPVSDGRLREARANEALAVRGCQVLKQQLARREQELRDARHALRHLYPRPYAAPEQLSEFELWERAVIAAGLSGEPHPCAPGKQPCACDVEELS